MEKFNEMANRQARQDAEFQKQQQLQWNLLRERYGDSIPEAERQKWEKEYGPQRQIERLKEHIDEVRRHPDYKENPDLGPQIKDLKNNPSETKQSKFLSQEYRPAYLNPNRLEGSKTDPPKDKDKDKDPER